MLPTDTCCTLVPYFQVHADKVDEFKRIGERLVEKTKEEPKCLFYAFSFKGDLAHCREGYEDAQGILAHLDNVGSILEEALQISDISRLEIHGPEAELATLHEPLAPLNPEYFILENGFRR